MEHPFYFTNLAQLIICYIFYRAEFGFGVEAVGDPLCMGNFINPEKPGLFLRFVKE